MEIGKEQNESTILIVDDNPVIVRLLEALLTRASYVVETVSSGDEALEAMNKVKPDLVLLDVEMPGGSGFTTCQAIKTNSLTRDIPVIFVTSRGERSDIIEGFESGGQDYIMKPFTPAELLIRVKTHLTLRQVQERLQESVVRYRNLSMLDNLTGLYNTRYLYQSLHEQLEKHPDTPLSAIFIDIDSFKKVVDTHGHLNGSNTIAELAEVIMPLLPEGCYGVSYGGDEFVLILPDHDRTDGRQLMERIRRVIEETRFLSFCDLNINITVSSGIATFPYDGQTLEELLGNADHALFEAKRLGKNMVVSFLELAKEPSLSI